MLSTAAVQAQPNRSAAEPVRAVIGDTIELRRDSVAVWRAFWRSESLFVQLPGGPWRVARSLEREMVASSVGFADGSVRRREGPGLYALNCPGEASTPDAGMRTRSTEVREDTLVLTRCGEARRFIVTPDTVRELLGTGSARAVTPREALDLRIARDVRVAAVKDSLARIRLRGLRDMLPNPP
ncbi:MAG: hypothetical protein K2X99_04635 [Gemmatimonadaceae bacterium]|nr:hypothetical protein [Gemmatimonadaceae bacterium]